MRIDSPTIPAAPPPPRPEPTRGTQAPRETHPTFVEVLGEGRAARSAPTASRAPPPAVQHVRSLVQGALDMEREIDAVLRAARSGKTFSPAELLELQIRTFRYSQAVEVISRAADKLVGAVKQTLGTQV